MVGEQKKWFFFPLPGLRAVQSEFVVSPPCCELFCFRAERGARRTSPPRPPFAPSMTEVAEKRRFDVKKVRARARSPSRAPPPRPAPPPPARARSPNWNDRAPPPPPPRLSHAVERRRGLVVVHLHGHVRDLPEQPARALDRVPGEPRGRLGRGPEHRVGKLRTRLPPGLHLQVAPHAKQLSAVQQRVGVLQNRKDPAPGHGRGVMERSVRDRPASVRDGRAAGSGSIWRRARSDVARA